ncbi:MAG: hypothetical protein AAGB19_15405 [Cyanobacteria bacterium P01_F01_bin.3]
MQTNDDDKILNVDFHYAVCLIAADELIESLIEMYAAIWLLASGDEPEADALYRRTYHGILKHIADESHSLTVTDEFREQYEEQNNG